MEADRTALRRAEREERTVERTGVARACQGVRCEGRAGWIASADGKNLPPTP